MLKSKEELLPAGTVTAPAGADVYGLAGRPLSHQVTGGDDGALADAGPEGSAVPDELGGVELIGADGAGGVALELPGAGEVGVAVAVLADAASRATVTARGSDEGARSHVPASVVSCCPERVAAAT